MGSAAESLHVGNGPYRPFVTGRDLNILQQQQQQLDQQQVQQPGHSFSIPMSRRESGNSLDDTMAHNGIRVVIGENEGGQWSIYGSLTRSGGSFEHHRYQYYQQQQRQQRQQQQQQQHTRVVQTHNSVMTREHPSLREANILPATRANPPSHPAHSVTRRSPHAVASAPFTNNGVASPSSNIPIPSRYINSQLFNHAQNTSSFTAASTSSNYYRPSNIATGQNQYAYRQSNGLADYETPNGPRRHVVNGSTQSYSETVERAEAGGWVPQSHTSTAGPTSASWYDEPFEYRGRHSMGLKEVVRMACRYCETIICERGMKVKPAVLMDSTDTSDIQSAESAICSTLTLVHHLSLYYLQGPVVGRPERCPFVDR